MALLDWDGTKGARACRLLGNGANAGDLTGILVRMWICSSMLAFNVIFTAVSKSEIADALVLLKLDGIEVKDRVDDLHASIVNLRDNVTNCTPDSISTTCNICGHQSNKYGIIMVDVFTTVQRMTPSENNLQHQLRLQKPRRIIRVANNT